MSLGAGGGAAVAGTVGAGGSLLGGLFGSSAAEQASKAQAQAETEAIQEQEQEGDIAQTNLQPFRVAGQTANNALSNLYGLDPSTGGYQAQDTSSSQGQALTELEGLSGISPTGSSVNSTQAFNNAFSAFQNSPTYQFALQQGDQSLDRSAASKGLLLSGAQLKDSQAYGQGLASQQLGTFTSNLQSLYSGLVGGLGNLANSGQSSAAGSATSALATGGQIASSLGNLGTAQASGIEGSTSALNNGLGPAIAQLTGGSSSYGGGNNALSALTGGGTSSAANSPVASMFNSLWGSSNSSSTGALGQYSATVGPGYSVQ